MNLQVANQAALAALEAHRINASPARRMAVIAALADYQAAALADDPEAEWTVPGFADFPARDLPPMPAGWEPVEDGTAPCYVLPNTPQGTVDFDRATIRVYVLHADPALREDVDLQRYCVIRVDADTTPTELKWTDDWHVAYAIAVDANAAL